MANGDNLPFSELDVIPFTAITSEWGDGIGEDILALAAGTGLDDDSITTPKIDDGAVTYAKTDGTIFWEELGRVTLGSAGDTMTISSFVAKAHLRIIIRAFASGSIDVLMRYNNDSGNNYSVRTSDNGGADGTSTSRANIAFSPAAAQDAYVEYETGNFSTKEKIGNMVVAHGATAGAGTAPSRRIGAGKWANTSSQITRVDVVNSQSGDFAIGSQVIVLGHD